MTTNQDEVMESEFKKAIRVANEVLDTPYKDPDDNESMLARQFLRQVERLDTLLTKKREEIIKIKESVAKAHGTNKYDSCYDDCLSILS